MAQQDDFAPTEALVDAPAQHQPRQTLDIRFTGSGSEYFRIWIVNLLLTLVTFTLYVPFARARRIAYFQNNTLVGGDPLGFHADPRKMFRGYLLILLLGVGYWAVTNFVPGMEWVALAVFMLLWPALWRASLQFRLLNTSWRGVRLSFQGDLLSAYLSLLPFFLPALAFVLFLPAGQEGEQVAPDEVRRGMQVIGITVLVFVALLPWLLARIKRYQHGGYAFAQERTQLRVGNGRFYLLFLKTGLVSLLVGVLAAALLFAVFFLVMGGQNGVRAVLIGAVRPGVLGLVLLATGAGLAYLLLPLVTLPYFGARLQNLSWSGTQSPKIAFASALRFRDLFRVTLVNWLLIIVTLGLYWPFAKVRTARVKLEALSLEVQGPVDQWLSRAQQSHKGLLGDAAGDFFGMDMGL
ncbi:YjgN family protein [Hydrogenophaga sp.]|uniref:YjgN family protein n=1 Tax=Hydrogenophaga sp. TaxID=1904254 RepID=UPI003D0BC3F2